ncbi:MAG: hypothetical protein ACE5E9_05185 [Nitrospinaceae bacterium]
MNQVAWKFREMTKGEMNTDPIEGEFFSTEHLDSITDALVRETIQNSLDAGKPGAQVRVLFRISKIDSSGGFSMGHYLSHLQPHLETDQNGLIDVPSFNEPGSYLVIEDFGTRGLEGDPDQDDDLNFSAGEKRKNDFFYFWRNIGRSNKSNEDRGRWGLGKTVFQATSRINSFFGLTVRASDNRSFLMGQSVLKTHLANNKKYAPYGWYGIFDGNFCTPIEDRILLKKFSQDFGLARFGKSGLSVVIPYPEKSIELKNLVSSVLIHYFFPILSGDLVVEVQNNLESVTMDGQQLDRHIESIDFSKTKFTRKNFQNLFDLTRWVISLPEDSFHELKIPAPGKAPKWNESLFEQDVLKELQEAYEKKEKIALRVPLEIKRKNNASKKTHFNVYIQRDENLDRPEDHFIREGITLAGVRSLRQKGVRVIVSIADKALSTFLGDAENPAHTEWQERSPKFKGRYDLGVSCLRFVKNSSNEIVRLLSKPAKGKDKNLLTDLFFIEEIAPDGSKGSKDGEDDSASGKPAVPNMIAQDKEFRIQPVRGGFKISRNPKARSLPLGVQVTAAYEIRRGNPFLKYSPFDFEMGKPPIQIKVDRARIAATRENRLLIQIENPDFAVEISGFDPHRDLRVKTDPVRQEKL